LDDAPTPLIQVGGRAFLAAALFSPDENVRMAIFCYGIELLKHALGLVPPADVSRLELVDGDD
jgi:hypothetical protein